MSVTSWIRRSFKDAVSVTDSIPGGMNSSATTFTAEDGSTYPDGSGGDFVVTVDQGLSTEERILCSSRSGSVFTVAASGRGYGTDYTPQNHGTNATLLHTMTAQDLDEANQVAVATLGAITASGDLLVGSASHALTKLAKGTANTTLQVVGSTLAYVGFGESESQPVGDANADGTQTTYARSDHAHQGVTSVNGGTGALSMTNGYGISGADSNPPVPAVGLTATGGTLGANYSMTGTLTNFMTTGTLQPGTYLVTVSGSILLSSGLQTPEIEIVQGTATATFNGPTSCNPTSTGSGTFDTPDACFSITTVAVVTVEGALAFQAKSTGGGTVLKLTSVSSLAGATGWTATRIA